MLKIYRIFAYEVEGYYGPRYPYEIKEENIFETIDADEITEELIQKIKGILFNEIKSRETVDRYDDKIGWVTKPRFKHPKENWIDISKKKNGKLVEITFTFDYEMEGFVIVKT